MNLPRYRLRSSVPWMTCDECTAHVGVCRVETRATEGGGLEHRFVCAHHPLAADLVGRRELWPSEERDGPIADPAPNAAPLT